jgi:hypothetical protein
MKNSKVTISKQGRNMGSSSKVVEESKFQALTGRNMPHPVKRDENNIQALRGVLDYAPVGLINMFALYDGLHPSIIYFAPSGLNYYPLKACHEGA